MIRGQAIRAVQQTELRKRRYRNRRWAHDQLVHWSSERGRVLENLGYPEISVCKQIQLQGEGASQRGLPPELTAPERYAFETRRILTIERVIADMPADWRAVIAAVYLLGRSIRGHAQMAELDKNTVLRRLHSAQECLHRVIGKFECRDGDECTG